MEKSDIAIIISLLSLLISYFSYRKSVKFKEKEFLEKHYDRKLQYRTWFKLNFDLTKNDGNLYLTFTASNNKAKIRNIHVYNNEKLHYTVDKMNDTVLDENESINIVILKGNSDVDIHMRLSLKITISFYDMLGNEFSQEFKYKNIHDYTFSEPMRTIYLKKPKPFLGIFRRYNKLSEGDEYKPDII